jgi:hypothetical protein
MNRLPLIAGLIFTLMIVVPVRAHEIRPAYLELRQTGGDTIEVLWKVPARGDLKLGIQARLPENCESFSALASSVTNGAFTDRWKVTCPGGLTGGTISIEGLSATLTDALVRIELLDGTSQVARLTPDAPSFVVEASPTWYQIAATYLGLGVEHILLGIDHLLFVLALLLLVTDGHGFYRGAQYYPGCRDPGFCAGASTASGSGHRFEHCLCGGRTHSLQKR